ncbi:MAG: MFS transporter [Verrucomicrobia bacterium]|nr:MFS transporter [Verrucomicrobiota bacterium]
MSSANPSLTQPSTNYRWVVCGLLFFATTINYIDRQILALIKPILDEQLHWTNEQFGYTNAFFQLSYAVSLMFFGWFVDKYGTKIGYAVSIAAWSVAAVGHALVMSITGFYAARIALGLGEGGNFPSAIKAVALWFPKRERATATAVFNSGTNVGAIIAPLVVPAIALSLGWHWAFIFAGIAGFLWLFLWFPFYNVPEKIKATNAAELEHIRSDQDDTSRDGEKVSWRGLLGYRQTWAFVVAKALTDPVWWFFLTWLPDFFKQTRHLDIKQSGYMLATIYGMATVLSIFGGWLVGAMVKSGWSVTRARKTGMFIFACGVLPIVLVKGVGDWTAVLLIGLACAAHQAWSANLFTTASDMFPKRAVASVVGLGGMAGSGLGFAFPILAGKLLDVFKAKDNISGGYAILFAICAGAYLLAFALQHILAPKFEMTHLKEET